VGKAVIDLIAPSSQEEVFHSLLGVFDSGEVDEGTVEGVELVCQPGKGFVMDSSFNDATGGVLVLFQASDSDVPVLRKRRKLLADKEKEDVALRGMSAAQGYEYHKFRVDDVNLAHQTLGGALGQANYDLTMERVFMAICEGDDEQGFTMKQLQTYMIRTPEDQRPECLRKVNPWLQSRVRAVFEKMDLDSTQVVNRSSFKDWWHCYVVEDGAEPLVANAPGMNQMISIVPASPRPGSPDTPSVYLSMIAPVVEVITVSSEGNSTQGGNRTSTTYSEASCSTCVELVTLPSTSQTTGSIPAHRLSDV